MPDLPKPGHTSAADPVDTLAALAGQLDRLRRSHEAADVPSLRSEVRSLVLTVAALADQVAKLADDRATRHAAAPSWLWRVDADGLPMTPTSAGELLDNVVLWSGRVYMRYRDAELPECWLWHPDVVEELVCLWWLWHEAYLGKTASARQASDWHDRLRPGAVRRIASAAGTCSLREHFDPSPSRSVPTGNAASAIAAWWAGAGSPPPIPTNEQVRAADAVHSAVAAVGRRS